MATWVQFETEAPDMAVLASRLWPGGMIESASEDPLFEFDIEQVDVATWVDIGQPGTHAVRRQWRAG